MARPPVHCLEIKQTITNEGAGDQLYWITLSIDGVVKKQTITAPTAEAAIPLAYNALTGKHMRYVTDENGRKTPELSDTPFPAGNELPF